MKSRRLLLAGLVLLLAVAGMFGFFAWQRTQLRTEVLANALPQPPDLSAAAPALQQRHEAAITRLRNGPDRVNALNELSRLYHANGYYSAAADCYVDLAVLEPKEPVWPHRHAAILAGFGDASAAIPLARRAVDLAPEYTPAQLRLADLLLKDNQIDAATSLYREILEREPGEPYAELGLARCDFEAGRWTDALKRLEPLVASTNYRLGYDLIVTVYERLGQPQRAAAIRGRELASGAFREAPDPWIDGLLEDCYDPFRLSLAAGFVAEKSDLGGATRLLERAIQLSPGTFALHFQLGGVFMVAKSYAKAREQFERCTQLAPEFPDGWIQLSELQLTMGDRTASDRTLAAGLHHCPNSPGMHITYARRLHKAGRIDDAVREYETAARLRPNEAGAFVELARLLIAEQRFDEARQQLEHAVEAEPDHPEALGILAFDAISRGAEPAARRWMSRVLAQPRTPTAQRNRLIQEYAEKFGRRPD